jgi:integrase
MPRLVHSRPKYRKHSTGQAVVTLNGRDFCLGRHGTNDSRIAYARLVERWEQNDRQPIAAVDNPLTVVELCGRYLRFAASYYRAADPKNQNIPGIKRAIRFLRELHGRIDAIDFGPLALKAVRQRMIDDGLSRGYINGIVGIIVRMFRWAVAEELVPGSVYDALRAVGGLRCGRSAARETERVSPVDVAMVEATLPHVPDVVADMVRLQLLTGMRPGEVRRLRPIEIDRSADVWAYRPKHHKTEHHGKKRSICMGPQSQNILLCYLARDPESNCFRPCDSEAKRLAAVHSSRKTRKHVSLSRKLSRKVSCAKPKHKNWSRHEKPRLRRLPRYLSTQALNSRRGRKSMSCANKSGPSNTSPPQSPWQQKCPCQGLSLLASSSRVHAWVSATR